MMQVQDIILFVFTILLVYHLTNVHFSRTSRILRKNFPGPAPLPVIGNIHKLLNSDAFLDTFTGWAKEYDFVFRIFLANGIPFLALASPPELEKAMPAKELIEKSFLYKWAHSWFGKSSVLLAKGDTWHRMRKLITPAFHFRILQTFHPVLNDKARSLCDVLEKKMAAAGGQPINVCSDIGRTTFEVVCETSMGISSDTHDPEIIADFLHTNEKLMDLLIWKRARKLWANWDFIWNLTPDGRETARCIQKQVALTDRIIEERKRKIQSKDFADLERLISEKETESSGNDSIWLSSTKYKVAFLDLLLLSQREDPTITDENIRDNTITILVGAQDTTATSIIWTIYNLGRHPEYQKIVQRELDQVFGDEKKHDLDTGDLKQLKYLECCIKESLRMFPPLPMISRNIASDFQLDDHRTVPAGSSVMFAIYATHHNPKAYPNPEKFDPSRFFPENAVGRNPFAFVPFSAGPRNCIGQRFAMLELKIVLAHIFRKFSIQAVDSLEEVVPLADTVLRPKNGIRVVLTNRTREFPGSG